MGNTLTTSSCVQCVLRNDFEMDAEVAEKHKHNRIDPYKLEEFIQRDFLSIENLTLKKLCLMQ